MPLPNLSALIPDLSTIFHPGQAIYARGEKIGYFTVQQRPCSNEVTLFPRTVYDIPPNEWTTLDMWGRQITLTQWCATKGLVPAWGSRNAAGVISAPAPVTGQPPLVFSPNTNGTYAQDIPIGTQVQNAVKNPLVLVAAGAAVLGVALLASK